jgi:general secretion pathway protein G
MKTQRRLATAGFTLIEIVIIIAVLTILATAITPALLQRVMDQKIETTRQEAKTIHEAIVGRSDMPGQFGFVGDMGRFPASFEELLRPQREAVLFSATTFRGVGMGWKGPYINVGDTKDDVLTDAFGRPYGGITTGQIRSAGPDGVMDNDDDIVYPPTLPNIRGRVLVTGSRRSSPTTSRPSSSKTSLRASMPSK